MEHLIGISSNINIFESQHDASVTYRELGEMWLSTINGPDFSVVWVYVKPDGILSTTRRITGRGTIRAGKVPRLYHTPEDMVMHMLDTYDKLISIQKEMQEG